MCLDLHQLILRFLIFYDYESAYRRKEISKQYNRSCPNKFYYYITLVLYIFLKRTVLKNIVSSLSLSRPLQLKFISLINISYQLSVSIVFFNVIVNLATTSHYVSMWETHFTFECSRTFPLKLTFVTETFLASNNTKERNDNVQETAAKIEIKQYVPSHSQPLKNSQIICIRRPHAPSSSSTAFSHRMRYDDRSWYVPSSVESYSYGLLILRSVRWQMKEILRYIAQS